MFAAVVQQADSEARREASAGYWAISRGPLASLAFIVPLLGLYEAGVLGLGPHAVRNGADMWLRGLLDVLGFGQYLLLPAMTVLLLLTWHHLSGQSWRLPLGVLPTMAAESLALAFCLVMLAQLQGAICQAIGIPARETPPPRVVSVAQASSLSRDRQDPCPAPTLSVTAASPSPGPWARLIAFLGAGIYEEVLFRLMLLPACVFALGRLGLPRVKCLIAAVLLTSLVFALAHYIGPHGDRWQAFSFLFRMAAGGFFAVLFLQRGFGVAAGSHAGYDILVGLC